MNEGTAELGRRDKLRVRGLTTETGGAGRSDPDIRLRSPQRATERELGA